MRRAIKREGSGKGKLGNVSTISHYNVLKMAQIFSNQSHFQCGGNIPKYNVGYKTAMPKSTTYILS